MKLFFTLLLSQLSLVLILIFLFTLRPSIYDYYIKKLDSSSSRNLIVEKLAPKVSVIDQDTSLNWDEIDTEIKAKIRESKRLAYEYSHRALNSWKLKKIVMIDSRFLPWYFSYWNQQLLIYESLKDSVEKWVVKSISSKSNNKTHIDSNVIERVSSEFELQVFPIELTRLELEYIVEETVRRFIDSLQVSLTDTQRKYNINHTDWRSHIVKLSSISSSTEGLRDVSLSLKIIASPIITKYGMATFSSIGKVLSKVTSSTFKKVSGRLIAKTVSSNLAKKATTKTMMKLGKRRGLSLISGPFALASLGIVSAWEYIDHKNLVDKNKPILRQSLIEYLDILIEELEGENGIFNTSLEQLSGNIVK